MEAEKPQPKKAAGAWTESLSGRRAPSRSGSEAPSGGASMRQPVPPTAVPARTRPKQAAPSGKASGFKVGDKVQHAKFGEGIVTEAKPTSGDFEITVAFKNGSGVKRLLMSFAKLEKVS
jgi:DNA helicase-2/ATP-dependent DNA helicase PcrA